MIITSHKNIPLPKPGTLFTLNSKAFPLYVYQYKAPFPPSQLDLTSNSTHRLYFVNNNTWKDYYFICPPLFYLATLLAKSRRDKEEEEENDQHTVLIHLFLYDCSIWYISEGESQFVEQDRAIFSPNFLSPLFLPPPLSSSPPSL